MAKSAQSGRRIAGRRGTSARRGSASRRARRPARSPRGKTARKAAGGVRPAKVTRKLAKPSRPPRSPAASRAPASSVDSQRIREILVRLDRAHADLVAIGAELRAAAHGIGAAACDTLRGEWLRSLLERDLLRDLQVARQGATPGENPAAAAGGDRLLPESMLNWLCEKLDLFPLLTAGETIEVPAASLGDFDFDGSVPADAGGLIALRVVVPGLRLRVGKTVVLPPRVERIEPVAPT